MIEISKIVFDADALEADVELSSGGISIVCYFHPVESQEEVIKAINNELLAFNTKNIMLDDFHTDIAVKTEEGYYSYFLRGTVIADTKIKVGDFVIDIGKIPGDIGIGATVSCECMRIDMQ